MLEKCLVEYCSATLASMKSGSLFNTAFSSEERFSTQLELWNRCLADKGIRLFVLRKRGHRALIYVYRPSRLKETLERTGVRDFLSDYGYEDIDTSYALARLRDRMKDNEGFPHEIGIFLDYPLGDVIGFIENGGRNCKCVGCWKVYCDEQACRKKFAQYKKCHDVYMRLWQQGRSVIQLTVAA